MNYFLLDGLNQSRLKQLLGGSPNAINKHQLLVTPSHFSFGSVVDILALEGEDMYDTYFYTTKEKLSDKERYVVESVFNESDLPTLDDDRLILKYAKEISYQNNWKDDTILNHFKKVGSKYYDDLIAAKDRTMILEDDLKRAKYCVKLLKNDEFVKKTLYPKQSKTLEIFNKVVLKFEINGEECKGEMDRIIVDHKNKKIIPIDLKTTGDSVYAFARKSFWKYRYDIQAAFYSFGLKASIENGTLPKKWENYSIENYIFVVVESFPSNPPIVFKTSDEVEAIGAFGGTLKDGRTLEGYTQLIEKYKFHTGNNLWLYPKEYYENSGIMEINI